MARSTAPRFGIGEWYGRSFRNLSAPERKHYAQTALNHTKATAPDCPFKPETEKSKHCTKKGGICSLRLYESAENGSAKVVAGTQGKLRVTCPHRFKQGETVFSAVGKMLLGTSSPGIATEVRFLRRPSIIGLDESSTENLGSDGANFEVVEKDADAKSEDVGNIDVVLVCMDKPALRWCALEIQAVYFSGEKMKHLFEHIRDFAIDALPFPDRGRRPDYRSSGPKRLMPQLQIKVPTLRRWGKKMAVVVDIPWFNTNVVGVETVDDVSNSDIAWFLVDFDETTDPATLVVIGPELQTLERAVEGLTGGKPVTLQEFEAKIQAKLILPTTNAGHSK